MADDAGIPRGRADRSQLQRIIAGLSDGVILIDPDQRIVWANEAALLMHGVETLDGLGGNVDQYRQRFELRYRNRHRIGAGETPMDRVVAGEIFADVVVEVGRPGEKAAWTHRLRSIVLDDADGTPDCLVLVIKDVTERYDAEERFERTFNANPAPAIICRLADLRHVKVNQGFQDMTGYARDDLIGRSVYEIDVLEEAENKDLAVERLREGRTIPQMEARLSLPGGGTKAVVVAGQPIDIGDEACMLFTFMDLEPRKRAEDALRKSEERFATSFRLSPVPTILFEFPSFLVTDVNEAFTAVTGRPKQEVVGRAPIELGLWEDSAARRHFEQAVVKLGTVRNHEIRLRAAEGVLDCLLSAEAVSINDKDCLLCALQDVTERRRSEMELIEAIETVMREGAWFSRTVVEKMANLRRASSRNVPPATLASLTPREREVLGLVCQAKSDDEIAAALGLSRHTIRNQVASIYGKADVHRRSELIVWARERGIVGEAARRGS